MEASEETAEGGSAESLADIEDISATGPEVATEKLFKQSASAVLEDSVISTVGVSETLLEVKAVTLTGRGDLW